MQPITERTEKTEPPEAKQNKTLLQLIRDKRGVSPYVAVIVLIALALMVYGASQKFGDMVINRFDAHTGNVKEIRSDLGQAQGNGSGQ
jgi:hypothetical protein